MTAFQRPGFSDLTMVPVEDPMELSTDMERRLLGDEDIDIDLSLDGRSPYVQEDDYMLEDGHFTEDQILFDGEQGGNDDEMADEVEPLEESDKIQEDQPDDNAQDPDEFDILVDDEDIRVEDTVIFSDGTTGLPSMLPYSVNESSDQQNYSQFPDQYASKDTDETSQVLSHPDYTDRKDGDFAHDYAPGLVEDTEIVTTTSDHADAPAYMMDHPGQNFTQEQHTIAQLPGDDLVGVSSDNPLESGATGQPLISTRDKAEGEEEGNNQRSDESVRHNQLDNGSPDRTSKGLRELAERKLSRNLGEPGNHTHIQSEDQGTSHRSPDEHGVVTEEVDATDGSFDEHFTDDSPEESSSPHDRMPLHPVIVVYQESEILLFPPHKHDGEQAETYFLEDESLAAQTIQALLQACRLVLADSINDHDELELQINSLGLEIREVRFVAPSTDNGLPLLTVSQTSNSSTTTSLAQILDIYLKLHHNDGLADPDPLQMTLTTKLSFPHRLEYLLGAVAEGKGLLDVTKSSKAEYLGDFEEGSEYNGENLQETAAPFGSEAGGAVDEGSTLNEAHDWTVNDYHAPASDTNDYQELNPAGSPIGPALHEHAIDDQGQQAQIEEATGPSRVEVSKTNQTSQGSNMQLGQAVVYTAGDPAYHPPAQHIQTFHEASTVKNESKERSEAKHIASPASSTLKGDSSDFAGGKL